MGTFMYIWGLNEVLCTVDEEDWLNACILNILLVEFDIRVFLWVGNVVKPHWFK